jgi:RNA polymerase sigma-70 factor (ECF subfamily)
LDNCLKRGKALKINGFVAARSSSGGLVYHHRKSGHTPASDPEGRSRLASRNELSAFLAGVERRAFKQAVFAVRDEEAALDIVQDAMMRLAERYGDRSPAELPPLFQRILQNAIRDWYRRQKVRSLWVTLLSSLSPGRGEEDDQDPLETLAEAGDSNREEAPGEALERSQVLEIIEQEISRLPPRQREAFLMRYWDELDVAETAKVMGCSEGSVKTHCSRAAHALAGALKARGITL